MSEQAAKKTEVVKKSEALPDFSLRQHDIRLLICLAALGTLLAKIQWDSIDWVQSCFAVFLFIYTAISYWFIKYKSIDQSRTFDRLMTIDAGLIGVVLSLCDFSILPSILFATTIQFNSLINGGFKKWALDNVALISGMVFAFFVHEPQWTFSDKIDISSISLIGVVIYFCSYALYAHKKINAMETHIKRLSSEHTNHKLRTYKLSRYLTPTVWKAISEGNEKSLTTERKRITIFFSDIQGFSALTEELEAESLTEVLNSYLTEMARIATKHKGTIDKFMGDAVMVMFGDSQSEGLKEDCLRGVSMAIEMRKKMKELQTRWYNQGIKNPLLIRMGINTGFCTVGSFGTSHYMDYTVLGTNVNLASRLESAADPGEILLSHESWALVKDVVLCRDKGEITVKGFSNPIRVHQVIDFRKNLGKEQSWLEENTEGFSLHMDLDKIRNYDRKKVLEALKKASEKISQKIIK